MSNLLRSLRESAGLSQRALANEVGVSRTKIFDLEQKSELNISETDLFSKALARTIDLSYVAGLFDRASTFNIIKVERGKIHDHQRSPSYIAGIQFSSKYKLLCDVLKEVFGVGSVCPVKTANGKPRWVYFVRSQSVDTVLEMLIPYLRLKREKANVLQQFRKFLIEKRDEYRASPDSRGIFSSPEQDINSPGGLTIAEFAKATGLSNGAVRCMIGDGRLKAKKVPFHKTGIFLIYPLKDGSTPVREGTPLSDEVLAKYEHFYNQIRKV